MMEMVTPSFQMLLQQTATKVTKHGMHQDNPGLVTTNTHNSSVQPDAFPVLILHVVERRRTMPIIGHTENPTATDYFWVFSAVQPRKFLLLPHARRWQALDFREKHDWLQAGVYPALERCSRTDCCPTGWEGWCGPTAGQHMLLMHLCSRLSEKCFCGTCVSSHKFSCLVSWHSFLSSGAETARADTQMLSLN